MAECSPEVPLFSHVWQTVFEAGEPCSHWLDERSSRDCEQRSEKSPHFVL